MIIVSMILITGHPPKEGFWGGRKKRVIDLIGGKWKILILCVMDQRDTVRVEYTLTKKAKSIIPILLELKRWGEKYL